MTYKLVSLNVALPETKTYNEGKWVVQTSGYKQPVPQALLRSENLAGNFQADLVNHGGPDKAVCVYAADHYPFWESVFGQALLPGAFSENFTVQGLLETAACIGDIYEIGTAQIQISQPRMPCRKLAAKHNKPNLVNWVTEKGYTGFYMRVLREGWVHAGDTLSLAFSHAAQISICQVNDLYYRRSQDVAVCEALLDMPECSAACKAMLRQLAKE